MDQLLPNVPQNRGKNLHLTMSQSTMEAFARDAKKLGIPRSTLAKAVLELWITDPNRILSIPNL